MRVFPEIVEQHAEDAAFLWLLRDAALRAPNFSLDDLADLDGRVEAHLDGLRVAGDHGWEVSRQALDFKEPGEIFVAAVLACESTEPDRIEAVLECAIEEPALSRAFVSALGWLTPEKTILAIEHLTEQTDPGKRRIGVAASAIHRRNPSLPLDGILTDEHGPLRARGLRAAGELARGSLRGSIFRHLDDEDEECRYFAARSAALLGDSQVAVPVLREVTEAQGKRSEEACDLAICSMDETAASVWLRQLSSQPETRRLAVSGSGTAGNSALIPWLLQAMEEPALARLAGDAFTRITGLQLEPEGFDTEPPVDFVAGPSEDPDEENIEMDSDGDLPWPDRDAIAEWWFENQGRFPEGVRHVDGQPATPQILRRVLRDGFQRQRICAAFGLALSEPRELLFEVRAPGFRQRRCLPQVH